MLRIILILTTTLLLVACGAASGDTPPPTSEPTPEPIAEVTPATFATAPVATEVATTVALPTAEATVPATETPLPATATAEPIATNPVRGTPIPAPTEAPVDDSLGLPVNLSLELLKNSSYTLPILGEMPIDVIEGEYLDGSDPNMPISLRLVEESVAFGDIDGDGLEEAVVPFATNTGGTGVFVDIVVVSGKSGAPQQLATAFLGDRVIIQAITVTQGVVTVQMITSGPNDPLCCPTLEVTVPFTYENGVLTEGDPL